jgi:GTPase SAR1 family protein
MRTKQTRQIISILRQDLRFRVLVIGSANAGKTSILQRVCETTESPKIYRGGKEVRHGGPKFCPEV